MTLTAPFSKAELARRLGVSPETVTRWGDNLPQYAIAYITLYNEHEALRRKVKDFGESI